jgi:hypothetical protein
MNGADDFKSGVIRIKPVMSHNSAQRRRELEISVGEIDSPAVVDIFSLRLLLGPLDSWLDQRQQPVSDRRESQSSRSAAWPPRRRVNVLEPSRPPSDFVLMWASQMGEGIFDSITNLINSPTGQLAAGGALSGLVWKFFERVENVLTTPTKLEIARWLMSGEKRAQGLEGVAQNWPTTFAKVFDQVFGEKHLTWRCFSRSCLVSVCGVTLMFFLWGFAHPNQFVDYFRLNPHPVIEFVLPLLIVSVIPDYISLLKSRLLIKVMGKGTPLAVAPLILLDFVVAVSLAIGGYLLYDYAFISPEHRIDDLRILREAPTLSSRRGMAPLSAVLYPALFTTVWVTLYGLSGLLLRFTKRIGPWLGWFNRCFDIERKPLQSIGLVAGALVAAVYWMVVMFHWLLG